jgi:RNA polymerase sigma-70 factor (ECF subfamily)
MISVSELALPLLPAPPADRAEKDHSEVQPGSETTARRAAQASPDAEMAELCRRGDRAGYERLYREHGPRMKSIAWNMLRNQQDAEDAVQDTFLKVHRSIHTYNGQAAFSTWVYRILVNTCTDTQRGRQRQTEELPADLSARQPDVPLRVALRRALGQLSERHRMVFLLAESEGFSHAEIAEVMNIPVGTSKGWLFEARRELQRLLSNGPGPAGAALRRLG